MFEFVYMCVCALSILPPKNHQGLELITHESSGGPPPSPPMLLGQGYQTEKLPTVPPSPPLHCPPSHLPHSDSFYAGPVLQRTPPVMGARTINMLTVGP